MSKQELKERREANLQGHQTENEEALKMLECRSICKGRRKTNDFKKGRVV
jgi:hypothetical protein